MDDAALDRVLSMEEIAALGDAIAETAAIIDVATHRFLTQLREFDRVDGWHRAGALSCAHWLSWRVGMDLGAAREKVRVARRLVGLPLIDAALARGAISYSKVRAMTRVATADNEADLLGMAVNTTGSQLERICRLKRSVNRLDSAAARAQEECRRYVMQRSTDDGMVSTQVRLHPEEAARFLRAMQLLGGGDLADGAVALAELALTRQPFATPASASAPSLTPFGATQSAAAPQSAPPSATQPAASALFTPFCATPASAAATQPAASPPSSATQSDASAPPPAPSSATQPAASAPPSAPSSATQSDASAPPSAPAFVPEPALTSAPPSAATSALDTASVSEPARSPEGRSASRSDATDGAEWNGNGGGTSGPRERTVRPPVEVVVHISAADLQGVTELGDGISAETCLRLLCDSAVVPLLEDSRGQTIDVGRKRRTIPVALRRALEARDGGCRFPGCTNRRFVDAHHIRHWVDGGETSLANTVLLCRRHHRYLHECGFRLEVAGDTLVFRDAAGEVIPPQAERPQVTTDVAGAIGAWCDEPVTAPYPGWDGERVDYDGCIWALSSAGEQRPGTRGVF